LKNGTTSNLSGIRGATTVLAGNQRATVFGPKKQQTEENADTSKTPDPLAMESMGGR
jgi:hypothetical protein